MDWQEITFADNQPCISLISLKPYGILRILDDQCCFPQVSLFRTLDVPEPRVLHSSLLWRGVGSSGLPTCHSNLG